MKTIQSTTRNKRGEEVTFTISASKKEGNFYSLQIDAPFEIERVGNSHVAITNEGVMRNYTLDNFKLKSLAISQITIMPKGGTKKDRFTVQFANEDLR